MIELSPAEVIAMEGNQCDLGPDSPTGVGLARWLTLAAGAGLMAGGLIRRPALGLAVSLAGGLVMLLMLGRQNTPPTERQLSSRQPAGVLPQPGASPAATPRIKEPARDNGVTEASVESFPASDAPAWTTTAIGNPGGEP